MAGDRLLYYYVCVFCWALPGITPAFSQSQPSTDWPIQTITESWQYRWGESPRDSAAKLIWLNNDFNSPEWRPTQSTTKIPGRNGRNTLWLRVKLPSGVWGNPTLFLGNVFHHFEVYLDDQLIYKIGEKNLVSYRLRIIPFWHLIPLQDFQNKTLTLRIFSDHAIGVSEVALGSMNSVLKRALKFNIDQIIIGSFLVLLGLVSISILLQWKAETRMILSFGVFAIANGVYTLTQTQLAHLFLQPGWYYAELFSFHLAAAALCYFFEHVFGSGYKSLVRRFWQIILIHLGVVLTILEFTTLPVIIIATSWGILTLFALLLLVGTALRAALQGNAQAKIFTVGITALTLFVLYDVLCALQVIATPYSMSHWGIFLFIISLGVIVERRFAETQASLQTSREQLRNLAMHLQEAREEERTHVAREIHDELGQSLTGLKMDIAFLEELINEQDDKKKPLPLLNKLHTMSELLDSTVQSVRKIAAQLRPAVLDSIGLIAAIEWQAEEFHSRTGIQCECYITADAPHIEPKTATAVKNVEHHTALSRAFNRNIATKATVRLSPPRVISPPLVSIFIYLLLIAFEILMHHSYVLWMIIWILDI
ncbi:MAG: histidine kinase [bacterium]